MLSVPCRVVCIGAATAECMGGCLPPLAPPPAGDPPPFPPPIPSSQGCTARCRAAKQLPGRIRESLDGSLPKAWQQQQQLC